ncbi:hypothetical protein KC726_02310 [Candidatus Woesebacteria bacterium]|nr:hypothetical protein [Candidatus Woesebacteria bacterium]
MTKKQKAVLHVLTYFSLFEYPPCLDDIWAFLPHKMSKNALKQLLSDLVDSRHIITNGERFAFPQNSDTFSIFRAKQQHSKRYLDSSKFYLRIACMLPSICMLSLSGSIAMMNAGKEDDIDLFVVTRPHNIWRTRFYLLLMKKLFSLFSPIHKKMCINLIFNTNDLEMAKHKKNEFVGHELLQTKVIYNKNYTYEQLVNRNTWVKQLFPNVVIISTKKYINRDYKKSIFFVFIEKIFKYIQTRWLSKKKYSWNQERGNLWLIQKDYEKTIPFALKRV